MSVEQQDNLDHLEPSNPDHIAPNQRFRLVKEMKYSDCQLVSPQWCSELSIRALGLAVWMRYLLITDQFPYFTDLPDETTAGEALGLTVEKLAEMAGTTIASIAELLSEIAEKGFITFSDSINEKGEVYGWAWGFEDYVDSGLALQERDLKWAN